MVMQIAIIALVSLGIAFNSYAQDSNRQDNNREEQLEDEIQDIKERISEIEFMLHNRGENEEIVNSSDGWKSVRNWRRLTIDMSYSEVREILGEPHRTEGGGVARWYYNNGSRATFISDRLHSWQEPRQ